MRFKLIDRIISFSPWEKITTQKAVSFEEYSLPKPLGGEPGLPESLLVEAMLQAGNWLIILSSEFKKLGIIVGLRRVTVARSLRPGEVATIELAVRSRHQDSILFDGRCAIGEEQLVEGLGCMAVLSPLESFENPADLRVLYEEIGPVTPTY